MLVRTTWRMNRSCWRCRAFTKKFISTEDNFCIRRASSGVVSDRATSNRCVFHGTVTAATKLRFLGERALNPAWKHFIGTTLSVQSPLLVLFKHNRYEGVEGEAADA